MNFQKFGKQAKLTVPHWGIQVQLDRTDKVFERDIWRKAILGPKKFWVEKKFMDRKGSKRIWAKKKFWCQKNFGPK